MIPTKNPEPLEFTIIEAKATIEKNSKYEDGRIRIDCIKDLRGRMDGWTWCGMLVKNLYRGKEYHKLIMKQKPLYLAMHGGWNTTLQVDMWYKKEWKTIWCANNDFDSFAEAKKSADGYEQFIKDEGIKIAKLIDEGKTLSEIDKAIDDGHSGNTYGWALNIGINGAKNKKKAQVIRLAHNKKHGSNSKTGVVNPAVLSIEIPKSKDSLRGKQNE